MWTETSAPSRHTNFTNGSAAGNARFPAPPVNAGEFVEIITARAVSLDVSSDGRATLQDGLLQVKPFIFYNVDGFFHHLLEFLKFIALEGFAEPMPFIVVDDDRELSIVFRLFKYRYNKKVQTTSEAYENARKLAYELPYFLKRKTDSSVHIEDLVAEVDTIMAQGTEDDKNRLAEEFEQAYLEKEIERMYERLAKTGRDTSIVSDKLTNLKKRRKSHKK